MIKIGSIVRDTYSNKIGVVTQILYSATGRGVIDYEIFADGAYHSVPIGFLEVINE